MTKKKLSDQPDSQVSLQGKQLHDIRSFAELFFTDSFKQVTLSRDEMKFIVDLTSDADEDKCIEFEKKFSMVRIEKYVKVKRHV